MQSAIETVASHHAKEDEVLRQVQQGFPDATDKSIAIISAHCDLFGKNITVGQTEEQTARQVGECLPKGCNLGTSCHEVYVYPPTEVLGMVLSGAHVMPVIRVTEIGTMEIPSTN